MSHITFQYEDNLFSKFLEILVKFSKASFLLYEMSKELTFENFD